jgi:anti-sigma regulatory factor (Ser/Thr protein kinase)
MISDAASATILNGHLDQSVGVIDIDETAFHPARTIHRLLAGIGGESSRLDEWCIISTVTPSTALGWQAWLLYEVMLNLIARDHIDLHCLVHRSAVPRDLSDPMSSAHPFLATATDVQTNSGYATPLDQIAALSPSPVPDYPAQIDLVDPVKTSAPRHALGALAAGRVPRRTLENFQVAVTEIVTNAVRHGRRPINVRIWAGQDGITASVRDAGPGLPDPLWGLLPPEPSRPRGPGMCIARYWSDWLHVINEPSRFEVRLGLEPRSLAA